jgi:hypothetical protein
MSDSFVDYEKWRHHGQFGFTQGGYSYGNPITGNGVKFSSFRKLEHMTSEGHPWHMLGKTRLNLGGPFELLRMDVQGSLEPRWMRNIGINNQWANEIHAIVTPSGDVNSALVGMAGQDSAVKAKSFLVPKILNRPSETTMDAMGSQAINMTNPTNPAADLAMNLAEFISERKFFSLPGKAGSLPGEYLNYMFGVAPTVGAVQDLRDAIAEREKITSQYIRDSGRWVRRRAQFEPTRSTTRSVKTGVYPSSLGMGMPTVLATTGTLTTTTRSYQRFWFSGAFTYHLPKEGTRAREIAILDKLYGVRPGSTSVAWELMPFSWIADYKVSLGSSVQNIESFAENGIVMPYAYIMCHTRTEVEYDWVGSLRSPTGVFEKAQLTNTVTTESKMRRAANPFGFGVLATDLSPKQWSILAALGLTLVRQK